ncbi:MAG: alcohol dehydrogenase catalytic domain-containing protein [Gemmatimonadaceae bacterium]
MTGRCHRAAVLVDVGRLEVREVPLDPPAPHEVVVRVQAVGLCGTDVHIVEGHANYNFDEQGRPRALKDFPQILGHEIAGVVHEVGANVRDLVPGDRVIVDQGRSCVSEGRHPVCEYCGSGDSHQCEQYRELGITGLAGGFAEHVTVPAVNAVRIASDLAADLAACAEPLGCVLHATDMVARSAARYGIGTAGDRAVRSILICGGGPAGLLFVQYLRRVAHFDGLLMVAEPNAHRRMLAERFGAETVNPADADLVAVVAERTKGRRVELLVEASGSGAVFRAIPGLIRKQATVLLYGHGHAGVDLSVMNNVQFLEPTLVSPVGASGGHDADGRPRTYRRSLARLEEGLVDAAPLITHRYASLDALPGAFAGAHQQPDFVKGVLAL